MPLITTVILDNNYNFIFFMMKKARYKEKEMKHNYKGITEIWLDLWTFLKGQTQRHDFWFDAYKNLTDISCHPFRVLIS